MSILNDIDLRYFRAQSALEDILQFDALEALYLYGMGRFETEKIGKVLILLFDSPEPVITEVSPQICTTR